jgi:hypothetical protein
MTYKIQHHANTEGYGPSPKIWARCPVIEMIADPNVGYHFFDDFLNHSDHTSDQSVQAYDTYVDNDAQGIARAGIAAPFTPGGGVGGILLVDSNGTDNDEFVMSQFGAPWMITDDVDATAAPIAKKLWFECRIAVESIANNAAGWFVGLAHDFGDGVSVAKTLCLTDDDHALGAFSFLGFHVDAANGDAIDAVYKSEDGAATVNIAEIQVPVIDTWYKLGFVYDPQAPTAKRIRWFVNGAEQTTYVTGTQIAAATFPDLEPLAMVLCVKTGESAAKEFYMDWWRCAQLR